AVHSGKFECCCQNAGVSSCSPSGVSKCRKKGPGELPTPIYRLCPFSSLSTYINQRNCPYFCPVILQVRVIAVVLRSEAAAYRCHLCCEGHKVSTPLHISEGHVNIHQDHFDFQYGTADIMCPVPSGCETPSHVSVTSAADVPEVFLAVLNQRTSDSFPHNFTVCISTMFDFTNVLQLVQSMEMLQLLGVSRVVIYKTSCDADTQRLLDYYTDKGFTEVIPWSMSDHLSVSQGWKPEIDPGDLHYYGQLPALNDCVYRYMYQSRYVALHDVDELILPQSVDRWNDLMPLLEQKNGADKCHLFENYMFPHTFKLPPPVSETHHLQDKENPTWQGISGVNILDHLYHEPNTNLVRDNFKVIVSPRAVIETSVHGLLSSYSSCVWVDNKLIYTITALWHFTVMHHSALLMVSNNC
uniref:Glycosyltransferase family 92 protein n=1 Tax=Myripristis murdjan TaxID=586833 RepID=A0A667X3W7_9TELE